MPTTRLQSTTARRATGWPLPFQAGARRIGLDDHTGVSADRDQSENACQPVTFEAMAVVQEWLERPNMAILAPTDRHWPILQALIRKAQVRGALMMDAHLAALAIEHGAVLYTSDRDFSRFPGLKWVNPLEES